MWIGSSICPRKWKRASRLRNGNCESPPSRMVSKQRRKATSSDIESGCKNTENHGENPWREFEEKSRDRETERRQRKALSTPRADAALPWQFYLNARHKNGKRKQNFLWHKPKRDTVCFERNAPWMRSNLWRSSWNANNMHTFSCCTQPKLVRYIFLPCIKFLNQLQAVNFYPFHINFKRS